MLDFNFFRNEDEAFRLFRPLAYDERGFFVCDDLTAGFSYICTPISGWDAQVISTLSFALKDDYPENSMLSFSIFANPDIKDSIVAADRLREGVDDEVLRKSQDMTMGYLWKGVSESVETIQNTSVRNFQVIITFKMPISNIDVPEGQLTKLLDIKRTFEQRIQQTPLYPVLMDDSKYINLMSSMLHWGDSAEWKKKYKVEVDSTTPLNSQILQYDTKIIKQRHGIKIESPDSEIYCSMLTAKRLAHKTFFGAPMNWFGDPFSGNGCVTEPFLITANVSICNHSTAKNKLERQRNHYLKRAGDKLAKFAPKIRTITEQVDRAYQEVLDDERILMVSLNAMVFGRDERSAEEAKTTLQSKMSSGGLTMVQEDSYSIPSFINNLPFGACSETVALSQRYFTMTSKSALAILPIFGEWSGTGTPILQMVSRTGQLMSFSLFDSVTNYSAMVIAESGAGKSYFVAELIRAYLSSGGMIWCLDAGESYKKLCYALGGNYTSFNEESNNISLNMFTMIDDADPKAFEDSVEMLAGAILAMTFVKDSPTDRQAIEVESIITEIWNEHGKKSTIDHVRDACLSYEDNRISDIGHQLKAFCKGGRFGRYFDRPHNVEFRGNFNVLELDGLNELPRLKSVVLFMLMIQIGDELFKLYKKNRNMQRLVVLDESWDLILSSKAVADFVAKGMRRWRKANSGGLIITQNASDLKDSGAGVAIASNAATMIILKQKPEAIDIAEKENLLGLPSGAYPLLKKLNTVPGHYSEIFISSNRGLGIGRLIIDPVTSLMYSTKPQDNADIEAYQEKGFSLNQALRAVAEDRELLRYKYDRPEFLDLELNRFKNRVEIRRIMGINDKVVNEALERPDPLNEIKKSKAKTNN